jgi:type IV pilus assembly protein PilW
MSEKTAMNSFKVHKQRGFTMVELMIGLSLGLIASLAIFSTVSTFETQRRTTGSGADMQQNGLLALYSIEQDARMAGFGLIDASTHSMPCAKVNDYINSNVFSGAPILIANGATGTDIITINRLNSDTGGIVSGGNAATLTAPFSAAGLMTVDTNAAINLNDFILVSQPGLDCSLMKVSAVPLPSVSTTTLTVAKAANAVDNTLFAPGNFPVYASVTAAASAVVINLGPASSSSVVAAAATTFGSTNPTATPTFATTKYQINSNLDLVRSEDSGTTWTTVASNIVTVAGQYGITAPGSLAITCWTDATGNACSGTDWSNPSAADVTRIKAIRVGIVARSAQKTKCNNTTPGWFGGAIDVSTIVGSDWACYRYKIYQTVIPLRNVIWGNL